VAVRRAARIDGNHQAVAHSLERAGATVVSLAPLGNGVPDLLVGYHGQTFLLEVKDGEKPPSKRELTDLEREFFARWRGGDLFLVSSPAEALMKITNHEVKL
jgi:hypothetical protein